MVNRVKTYWLNHSKYCQKGHNTGQCPAKHVKCHNCSKVGHFAKVYRSSNSNQSQGQQVQKLQRKQTTSIKCQPGTKPSLPRSAPVHFMSAEGCIGVADYGTIDDNFDSVAWIDSIDITYDPATQQVTYGSTVTAIHNIQQRKRSQAFTRISMCPEETNGKIIGPHIEVKCKINTGVGANVMHIYFFRKPVSSNVWFQWQSTEEVWCRLDHPNSIWMQ